MEATYSRAKVPNSFSRRIFIPSYLPCASPSLHRNTSPKWLTLYFFKLHLWRHPGRAKMLSVHTKMIHKYTTQTFPPPYLHDIIYGWSRIRMLKNSSTNFHSFLIALNSTVESRHWKLKTNKGAIGWLRGWISAIQTAYLSDNKKKFFLKWVAILISLKIYLVVLKRTVCGAN